MQNFYYQVRYADRTENQHMIIDPKAFLDFYSELLAQQIDVVSISESDFNDVEVKINFISRNLRDIGFESDGYIEHYELAKSVKN